jgi:hypothetical protein
MFAWVLSMVLTAQTYVGEPPRAAPVPPTYTLPGQGLIPGYVAEDLGELWLAQAYRLDATPCRKVVRAPLLLPATVCLDILEQADPSLFEREILGPDASRFTSGGPNLPRFEQTRDGAPVEKRVRRTTNP